MGELQLLWARGRIKHQMDIISKLFKKTSRTIKPGDRVRITADALEYSYGEIWTLVATKDSIARAISFEEYCEHYNQHPQGEISPDCLKEWMKKGEQLPFIFESVAPPTPSISDDEYRRVICTEGGLLVIESKFYQVISD